MDLRIPAAILAGVVLFISFHSQGHRGSSTPGLCQAARIAGCYDGDTCEAIVDGRLESVRLVGFDSPELGLRARCPAEHHRGLVARDRLRGMIDAARDKQFCTHQEDYFTRDSYGRVLAILRLDGRDVAEVMLDGGYAAPSFPDLNADWCG